MKIAIIGSSGFLGTKLMKILSKYHNVIGASRNPRQGEIPLDATDKQQVRNFLFYQRPNIVIDTVALTSSADCESNPQKAYDLNYLTTKNIAQFCKEIKAKMIFISSSYVFDGENKNYKEEDFPNPLNEYGKTKLMAEKEVLNLENSIVIRLDIMYGYNGKNQQNGVFDMILSRKLIELREPNQIKAPVFIEDVASIILELIDKDQRGIFHVAGNDKISILKFLKKLEKIVRETSKISVLKNNKIKLKIPKDSSLDISKIKKLKIKTHSLDEGLEILKEQFK